MKGRLYSLIVYTMLTNLCLFQCCGLHSWPLLDVVLIHADCFSTVLWLYCCALFPFCYSHWHSGILVSVSAVLLWSRHVTTVNTKISVVVYRFPLSPSLKSVSSFFLCGNRKMRPPPRIRLCFYLALLLMLAVDVESESWPWSA